MPVSVSTTSCTRQSSQLRAFVVAAVGGRAAHGRHTPTAESGGAGAAAAAALLAVSAIAATVAPAKSAPQKVVAPRAAQTPKGGVLGKIDLVQQRNPVLGFGVGVFKKFSDDRAGRLAALMAYYGFFSVFPAMLALVTVLGFVLENNDSLRQNISDSALAQFPIVGDQIAASVDTPLAGNPIALVIGLGGAIWAGMGMVQAAQDAMNEAWAVERTRYPGFLPKRLRSLAMLVLFVVMLGVSTFAAQAVRVVASGPATGVLLFAAAIVLDIALFMIAYRLLTVADLTWRRVLPGAVFAGSVYTVVQYLGNLYVNHVVRGATETYGTFAVVIGLLSWIFLLAQVMMVGAEINTVAARRLWPRSLFGVATHGDRAVHASQATAQRMDEQMRVDVAFDDQPVPGPVNPGPSPGS